MSADAAGSEPAIRVSQWVSDERGLRQLVSPPGWPQLPPPVPGESVAAYLERLRKDPFLQELTPWFGEPRRRWFCPAMMTEAKWREHYPAPPIHPSYGDPTARPGYYPDMVFDRLLVALCDRLRAGRLKMRGVRLSSLEEGDAPLDLFRYEDMILYPHTSDGGQLRPEGRAAGLPEYRGLTLWPADDAMAASDPPFDQGEGAAPNQLEAAPVTGAQAPSDMQLAPKTDRETVKQLAAKYPGEGQLKLFKRYEAQRKLNSALPHLPRKLFPSLPGRGRKKAD